MQFDFSQQPGLNLWNQGLIKTEKPLVSIITSYYNGSKHIRQTCISVLNQTFPYFEWIIVDDGSTNAADIDMLEEISAMDPRIHILHKENGGISTARNFGIENAQTDLILPLDDDDLLEPTFVEYCWWMLEKNPDAAWAYSDSVGFQGQEYLWKKPFDPIELKNENILTATALIRKEALLAIGGYMEGNKHYNEDWYTWLKIIANGGYPVQSTGEYLFWYRRSDTGVLALVKTDKQIAKANRKLIASAAKEIRNPRSPIIYPRPSHYHWTWPQMSDWNGCVYERKIKKHIAFLFPHMEMGGADKFNLDLISGLDRNLFDVSILTTIPSKNVWQQRFREVTPNIFCLANFVEPRDFGEFISYYLKSRQVDILFVSNSYHGYYLIPWLRENFPQLVIVDYVHMEEWYWRNGGYARTSAAIGAVTEKTYVCNSATEQVMVEHYHRNPESVQTVHIGVDAQRFAPQIKLTEDLYQELQLPKDRPVVLFICRLHPQKRPFLMVEIAKRVARKVPNVAFVVVGDGPQEMELRNKVKDEHLERVIYFLGAKKDVRYCYQAAKVTLICSLKEGLSLTAYESCSMGVPVVSADVGGQKDLIDETVGALIPCLQTEADCFDNRTFAEEEIEAYEQALVSLLTDSAKWKSASENCRNRVLKEFTVQTMVEYFTMEFQHLIMDETSRHQRMQVAQRLKLCAPLAAELQTMEMQLHATQADLEWISNGHNTTCVSLIIRAWHVIKSDGLIAFLKKAVKWAIRKVHSLI